VESSLAWIEELARLRTAGTPCAMVVVTEVRGSGPREAGARMLVTREGLAWGTIGGGNLEQQALERAAELLDRAEPIAESIEVPLAESAGQCCGGVVTLFVETFPWRRDRVTVFGAGHVGQALAGLTDYLGADVTLIDGRDEEELQPRPPGERPWELVCIDAPEAEVETLPAGAYVLVMTHSHALDLEVVARAAKRDDLAFLGLIGSTRKWARFEKRLAQRGLSPAEIARITCPIGVTKGSKHPRAIAISVAAQLVDLMGAAAPPG
jgi:xanthine dehydrogenase accessory factor